MSTTSTSTTNTTTTPTHGYRSFLARKSQLGNAAGFQCQRR